MSSTVIGIAVVWFAGFVFSVVYLRRMRARRQAAGETVSRPSPALISAIIGFVIIMVGVVFGPGILAKQRHDELVETGTRATATITAVEETGNVSNSRPQVRVVMNVEPEGAPAFESEETWIFSVMDVQTYAVGTRVDVFFDPSDHETVAVVGVAKPGETSP